MNDVTDVICTLLLCKYPSIDAVYECSVPWWPRGYPQKLSCVYSEHQQAQDQFKVFLKRDHADPRDFQYRIDKKGYKAIS